MPDPPPATAKTFQTSDVVTSYKGRKRLIMVGDKVKAFFLSMIDVMGKQVLKSPLVVKGADYMEMASYCSSNRHMCGRVVISLRLRNS